MNIEIEIKNIYGNELKYVVNSEQARSLSKLTGRKTLTDLDIRALKELGFTFSVYIPQI
jgi:hypothetical protein